MPSRLDQSRFSSIVYWNPWTWITLIYASQVLGAVLVNTAFGIDLKETWLSISLLSVGTAHAFLMSSAWSGELHSKHNWVPAILYATFIFSTSQKSFKGVHMPINVNFFHPLEYAVLAIFFCWMGYGMILSGRMATLFQRVMIGGMAFAVADEIHQLFIPYRSASVVDLLLDALGLSLGFAIFLTGRYFRRNLARLQSQ